MLKRIFPLLILVLAIPCALLGQVTTSSISGTVKNANDEPLVGATITAIHQPSGTKYSTTSRTGGVYSINNMRVGGPYTIEVTFVGFQTDKQEEVQLKLAETFNLVSNLKPSSGELTNVVVTTAARRNLILNSKRTGAVTNVGKATINTMPSITRSINDFSRFTPQANGTSVGGGNYRQNNVTVDGSDYNNSFGIGSNLPAQGSPISLDAIEEISVSVTPFDVRQSGFIGSALNAVTRSGTNRFAGSVYTYFRNQNQNGNQVNKVSFTRQKFDFKQYGARISGPIIKNKLFFFLSYETEKTISPGQQNVAGTPTAPGPSGNIARPTRAELDAISTFLKTTYDYDTGPYDFYDFEGDKEKITARLDWNINDKHKMNIRYSQVESSDPAPMSGSFGSTGIANSNGSRTANNALWFKNSNYYQDYNFYSLAGEINSSFTTRLSNTLRFSYNRQDEPRSSDSEIFPFVDIYKDGTPFTSFGYEPFTFGNLRKVDIYSIFDNLTLNAGKHALLFGLQADFTKTLNGFQPLGATYYRYNSWTDFTSGAKPNDFAMTYSLSPGFAQAFPTFKFAQYSAYVQDEISVSKNFKITLGLRADRFTYPDVAEVKTNPLVAGLTFENGQKVNTGKLPEPKILFSPRVGFNYDIYGDRSLQLRGGTGIFTGRVPYVWIVGQSGNSGMIQVTQSFNGTANTPGPFNPDRETYFPGTVPPAGTVIPSTVTAFAEDFKMPQTWKTSAALDIRLPWGIIGTIEGIFNKDINTIYSRNINLVAPQRLNVAGYPDNRLIYPNANPDKYINKLTSTGQPGGTNAMSMILTGNESRGYYASLNLKLEKQLKGGFSAVVSYTKSFADNLFDGTGDQPINTWNGNTSIDGPNNPMLGYSGFVVPDRVIAAVSYRKEYFKHLGTQISLFYEGSSSGRFSYTYSSDFNRDGANADLIYIPKDARNTAEIQFVNTASINGIVYTPAQQAQLFEDFINQDKYLRAHRGQYAERGGGQLPWRNQLDVKLLQDLFINVGKNRNTIQFSVDIFNFGNLINKSWGRQKITAVNYLASSTNVPILQPQNVASLTPGGATVPTFRLATDRLGQIASTSFYDNIGLSSTYFMQFGLRYIFNN